MGLISSALVQLTAVSAFFVLLPFQIPLSRCLLGKEPGRLVLCDYPEIRCDARLWLCMIHGPLTSIGTYITCIEIFLDIVPTFLKPTLLCANPKYDVLTYYFFEERGEVSFLIHDMLRDFSVIQRFRRQLISACIDFSKNWMKLSVVPAAC